MQHTHRCVELVLVAEAIVTGKTDNDAALFFSRNAVTVEDAQSVKDLLDPFSPSARCFGPAQYNSSTVNTAT